VSEAEKQLGGLSKAEWCDGHRWVWLMAGSREKKATEAMESLFPPDGAGCEAKLGAT
jgi:hypothetical protein